MKGRYLMLGALCALAALVAFTILPESAFAAPLGQHSVFADHGWRDFAIQASPALIALRSKLKDLSDQAERKLAEVVDGLEPERVRAIEAEHATLIERAEGVRSDIAAEEARIAANPPADNGAALRAERQRSAEILDIAQRAGYTGTEAVTAINAGTTVEAFRIAAFDAMAARNGSASHIRVDRDETETRRQAMGEALAIRLAPSGAQRRDPSEAARGYMDLSIVEMAAERLGERRIPGSFGGREEIVRRAFHATTDFPIIFEGALNTALAARYALAQPTFRRIARQRTYVDFRDHTTVRVGDFPDLLPVNPEGGEIKAGTFSESKEKTAVKAYGVRVDFSRQMLVNDSLNALVQVLNDRGAAVARFEDRTFYAMMFSGANADGPTLLTTGRQVFNTTDKSKAGAGTAIDIPALSAARAALRKRKTKDGVELELSGSIILVGPDKETEAQQVLAPVQAQQAGNVNPFSGTLSIVVTAKITGNAWHVFASPDEAACFEWGLLEGYTAPRFRTDTPFGVQGVSMSLEHDFGCGAIDFNGGYKNAGN
jgi:hypothetical protein